MKTISRKIHELHSWLGERNLEFVNNPNLFDSLYSKEIVVAENNSDGIVNINIENNIIFTIPRFGTDIGGMVHLTDDVREYNLRDLVSVFISLAVSNKTVDERYGVGLLKILAEEHRPINADVISDNRIVRKDKRPLIVCKGGLRCIVINNTRRDVFALRGTVTEIKKSVLGDIVLSPDTGIYISESEIESLSVRSSQSMSTKIHLTNDLASSKIGTLIFNSASTDIHIPLGTFIGKLVIDGEIINDFAIIDENTIATKNFVLHKRAKIPHSEISPIGDARFNFHIYKNYRSFK